MKPGFPRPAPLPLRLAWIPVITLLAGCSGAADRADRMEATPDEVDATSSAVVTEREYAAFRAPADSVLTAAQIEAYLQTSLLQFDLVREHAGRMHERFREMERRAEGGGAVAGLRNLMDAGRTLGQAGDLIGGSYVRSARTLGHNPAELEWVRDRMAEVAQHLALKPMHEAAEQSARELRDQAARLRAELAADPQTAALASHFDEMDAAADEIEAGRDEYRASRAVEANVEVLRRARPAVTDPMWTAIGFTGGASGLVAWGGLSDADDPEAQRKLDEWRQLFTDALADRVTAGMEPEPR